jgi:hypothetical protein
MVRSIDLPVEGLADPINSNKTVHLFVVHGTGLHCIGYSDDLIAGLANVQAPTPER